MSTIRHPNVTTDVGSASYNPALNPGFRGFTAATRLGLGFIFFWAFLDKMFALGLSTGRDADTGVVDYFGPAAYVNGGSPTKGFLTFGTSGPLADFYQGIAGAWWADLLFMAGLGGIGLALLLGIGMRIATVSGAIMMVMMWSATLWPTTNPFLDEHIIYALALLVLLYARAGRYFGLGTTWESVGIVRNHTWLT